MSATQRGTDDLASEEKATKKNGPVKAYSLKSEAPHLEADPKRWVEVLEGEADKLGLETRVSPLDNFMCVEIFRRKANSIHALGYFLFRGIRSSGSMEVRAARGSNEFGEEVCRSALTDAIPIDKVLDALNGMVNRGSGYRRQQSAKKSLDNVLGEAVGALGFVKDIVELYLDKNKKDGEE